VSRARGTPAFRAGAPRGRAQLGTVPVGVVAGTGASAGALGGADGAAAAAFALFFGAAFFAAPGVAAALRSTF